MERRKLILLVAVWIGFIVAILPALFHWHAPAMRTSGHTAHLQLDTAYLAAVVLCAVMYRVEARRGTKQRAFAIVLLIVLVTAWNNSVHRYYVDRGAVTADRSNLEWQIETQRAVLDLSPAVAPHSYRFLPNALVRWLELGGIGYESARDIYRLLTNLLLFYALYRYARLFTDDAGALLAVLLVAAIYPVSYEYYAGQLTDPLSHLSFVLAFYFLETEDFACLLTALLIGSLAKETVLALAGYYVLFRRAERRYISKAISLCAASGVMYVAVRLLVIHQTGSYRYEQVSGVTPAHALANLEGGRWQAPFLLTAIALLPFVVAGWKQTPRSLKQLTLFLLPVLFISNLLFGWLFEARNYMPLVFVTAIATGDYLRHTMNSSREAKV